jgi:hypothetical protein
VLPRRGSKKTSNRKAMLIRLRIGVSPRMNFLATTGLTAI